MLFCDQCDRGYHIYCLGLRNIPEGKQTFNLDEFFIHIILKPFHIPQIQNYVGHKIIEFEMKITRMYFKNSCASLLQSTCGKITLFEINFHSKRVV